MVQKIHPIYYRNFVITLDVVGWSYTHMEFTGDTDTRYGNAGSIDECMTEIGYWYDEHPAEAQEADEHITVDAARWKALMSSARMHWMGSAGVIFTHPEGSNKALGDSVRFDQNPDQDCVHFGMEFWDKYPRKPGEKRTDAFARNLLTWYVDNIRSKRDKK